VKRAVARLLALVLCTAAALVASAEEDILVAEYIVPIAQIDNWNYAQKLFHGYNTETRKGFEFTRSSVPAYDYYYTYYIKDTGFAFYCYIAPEGAVEGGWNPPVLPEKYTRTITSPGSPKHRYLYLNVSQEQKVMEGFVQSGEISNAALEAWAISNGMDSSPSPKSYYEVFGATHVQCIHTDYVSRVTFKPNGGVGTAWTQSITNEADLAVNTFTREGYAFSGWNTQPDGSGETFADGKHVKRPGHMDLYAQWTGEKVTVTFDANEGSLSGPPSAEVTVGQPYGTFQTYATMTGHDADLWYDAKTGGEKITAKTIVTNRNPHTLYAHWTRKSYSLVITVNEGVKSVEYQVSGGVWQSTDKSCEVPVPFDDEWSAYAVAKDGWEVTTQPKSDTMGDRKAYYTANAKELTYAVNYKKGTGEGISGSEHTDDIKLSKDATLRDVTFSRGGYTQQGWSRTDGGEKDFALGATYTERKDIDLYPYWVVSPSYVKFDPVTNAVTGVMSVQDFVCGGTQKLFLCAYVRTGYLFDGWRDTIAWGREYADGADYTPALSDSYAFKTNTLYAIWRPDLFDLTFDGQGGTFAGGGGTLKVAYTNDLPYGAFPSVARDGFVFAGWWRTADFAGEQLRTDDVASKTLTTLYARWKAIEVETLVTVTFNANGGTGGGELQHRKGTELGKLLDDPVRTGYRFTGWYTGTDSGTRVTGDTIIKAAATFYARWSDTAIEAVLGQHDGLAFSTDATGGWYRDGDALRSGAGVKGHQRYDSTLTMLVERGGQMTFSWSMDGYKGDIFDWYLGDTQRFRKSGSHAFSHETCDVYSTDKTVEGIYSRPEGSPLDNAAWVKNLTWSPTPTVSPIAAWTNDPARANMAFTTGGATSWQMATPNEGIMSGTIGNGEFSWVRATTKGAGTLTFCWRTDCEGGFTDEAGAYHLTDRLELRVDGVPVDGYAIGGSNDWTRVTYEQVSAGEHTYEWRYVKDADTSVGLDRAWLDGVRWEPVPVGSLYLIQ